MKYYPSNAKEWAQLLAATATPTAVYEAQPVSDSLADSIGVAPGPRGIRSSYDLTHDPDRQFASVREIPVPTVVVVDEVTGVLRCRWERVA